MTVQSTDAVTGVVREASVSVAAMGASNFAYAEVVEGEDLRTWLGAHMRGFEFFGCVPPVFVPDNLKSGVTRPWFYDLDVNPSYREMAEHYGSVVIPTRVRKPRDKAKVENAVQQVEGWVLAPLRNEPFFSLREANETVRQKLDELNDGPHSKPDALFKNPFATLGGLRGCTTERLQVTLNSHDLVAEPATCS